MQMHDLHARIEFEQRSQMISVLESIAVTLFGVVTAAILPQLIVQYLLRDGQIPESQPFILQYLPHISYGVAALWFVLAFLQNLARSRRIRQYREEIAILEITGEGCECGGDCDHHHDEEMTLEMDDMDDVSAPVTEEVMVPEVKAPRRKKAAAKKTTKTRTSKK